MFLIKHLSRSAHTSLSCRTTKRVAIRARVKQFKRAGLQDISVLVHDDEDYIIPRRTQRSAAARAGAASRARVRRRREVDIPFPTAIPVGGGEFEYVLNADYDDHHDEEEDDIVEHDNDIAAAASASAPAAAPAGPDYHSINEGFARRLLDNLYGPLPIRRGDGSASRRPISTAASASTSAAAPATAQAEASASANGSSLADQTTADDSVGVRDSMRPSTSTSTSMSMGSTPRALRLAQQGGLRRSPASRVSPRARYLADRSSQFAAFAERRRAGDREARSEDELPPRQHEQGREAEEEATAAAAQEAGESTTTTAGDQTLDRASASARRDGRGPIRPLRQTVRR